MNSRPPEGGGVDLVDATAAGGVTTGAIATGGLGTVLTTAAAPDGASEIGPVSLGSATLGFSEGALGVAALGVTGTFVCGDGTTAATGTGFMTGACFVGARAWSRASGGSSNSSPTQTVHGRAMPFSSASDRVSTL